MSFHWSENAAVSIDNLVGHIIDELVLQSWTEPDVGYDVVRNPDADFDVYMALEATNKRYIQFEIGNWNTGTHVMNTPKISFGALIADMAASFPAGTETGQVEISFDDDYFIVVWNYRGNGADFRNCFSYVGFLHVYTIGDEMLTGGSSLFKGNNATPTNDTITAGSCIVMKDLSGATTKPIYMACEICPYTGWTAGCPRLQIKAAKQNYRYLMPVWIGSNSTLIAGGENAGIRGRLQETYGGQYYDTMTNGQTLEAADSKIFRYFSQLDAITTYSNFSTRLLYRKQ